MPRGTSTSFLLPALLSFFLNNLRSLDYLLFAPFCSMTSQIQPPPQGPSGDVMEMAAQSQKAEPNVDIWSTDVDNGPNHLGNEFKSTAADATDMRRMGKDQQLVRHFRVLSMASFVAVATAAWEFTVFNLTAALTNGGRPTLVYSVLWNFVGFAPIYLSMAEMASMAPIAGAQYHWVSEFAPESLQRGLSYLTG